MMQPAEHSLLPFVTRLADSADRASAIGDLSAQLDLETFIIFVSDPDIKILLPAPGFPQTLPSGKGWRSFLRETSLKKNNSGELPWNNQNVSAQGVAGTDGTVAILLGKPVSESIIQEFGLLLPLLAAALNGERAAANFLSQTKLAEQIAEQSNELARRLDEARRAAQREIAARIKAEGEVRRINENLEKRVRERTQSLTDAIAQLEEFSYTVAHDLRAPLRSISSFSEILINDYSAGLPNEATDFLHRIQSSSERMNRLTHDLISYTKVANAEFPFSAVNLDRKVEEALSHFNISSPKAEINVRKPLGSVWANELLLSQTLNNLLDNASKYSSSDRPLTLELWSEERAGKTRLNLKDNGLGISPKYQDRIFKIFERVEIQKPGTGIGLAIVKRAMERMGGTIGVISTLGVGSTFWLELPQVGAGS